MGKRFLICNYFKLSAAAINTALCPSLDKLLPLLQWTEDRDFKSVQFFQWVPASYYLSFLGLIKGGGRTACIFTQPLTINIKRLDGNQWVYHANCHLIIKNTNWIVFENNYIIKKFIFIIDAKTIMMNPSVKINLWNYFNIECSYMYVAMLYCMLLCLTSVICVIIV